MIKMRIILYIINERKDHNSLFSVYVSFKYNKFFSCRKSWKSLDVYNNTQHAILLLSFVFIFFRKELERRQPGRQERNRESFIFYCVFPLFPFTLWIVMRYTPRSQTQFLSSRSDWWLYYLSLFKTYRI